MSSIARQLRSTAEHLVTEGRLREARPFFERACRQAPDDDQGWAGLAAVLYQTDKTETAAAAARKAIGIEPGNAEAQGVLAECLLDDGHFREAVEAALNAINAAPNEPKYWLICISALLSTGDFDSALELVDKALHRHPDTVGLYVNRGVALVHLGRSEEALAAFTKALQLDPHHVNALLNRTAVLSQLGRLDEAATNADRLVALAPNRADVLLNQAAILLQRSDYSTALDVLDRLSALAPDNASAYLNRAIALVGLGRFEEALQAAHCARESDPAGSVGRLLEANALLGLGRFGEAYERYHALLEDDPTSVEARAGRIRALYALGAYAEAMADLQGALVKWPQDLALRTLSGWAALEGADPVAALDQVGTELEQGTAGNEARAIAVQAFAVLGETERAISVAAGNDGSDAGELAYSRALAYAAAREFDMARDALADVDTVGGAQYRGSQWGLLRARENPAALYADLVETRLNACIWFDYSGQFEALKGISARDESKGWTPAVTPYQSLAHPFSPERLSWIARSHSRTIEARARDAFGGPLDGTGSGRQDGRLRIGYVSADFRNHPTAHLMRSLFGLHDRERFEVFCYSLHRGDGSEYQRNIEQGADHFVELTALDDGEAARRVAADGIDIVVDLMVHTRYARPGIFALRPAPVQVAYLAFPGTSGSDSLQFILCDQIVVPKEQIAHYSETPVYLPYSYQVNDRWQPIAESPGGRGDHGLPEEGTVFACFCNNFKLDPVMFAVWMDILKKVPDSVLWLLKGSETMEQALRLEAERLGVAADRLIFADRRSKAEHLARLRLADLFLDTRIYGAHTTASDALWAGLPVLTCMGDPFAARVGASLLHAVGLSEMVTRDLDAYAERAVELANDTQQLQGVRRRLQENRLTHPLFDTERFARDLEQAYEAMWQTRESGESPAYIEVAPTAEAGHGAARS